MQSKKLPKTLKYQKELKKLLNKEVIDIFLFGSLVKSGIANDIDVALLINKGANIQDIKIKIKKIIGDKADIEVIDIDSIYSSMWLTLIKEGFSIKKERFVSDIYGVKPQVLYKYQIKKLSNVQKVQFERGIKNVIGKEGVFLTRSVVIIPITKKSEMVEFLKQWDIYYESKEYELLPVLRKESFI